MTNDNFGYFYAATVCVGGIIGYLKAASLPSLATGLVFGLILGIGARFNSKNPPKPLLQLVASIVLAIAMGLRWSKSGKLMPAGIMCMMSCISICRNLLAYNRYLPIIGRQQQTKT